MSFRNIYVLARKDSLGPYGPDNCYWRRARTAKEARMGIEEWNPDEPEDLPLTLDEELERDRMPESEQRMFDIWKRMMWRSEQSKFN